MTKELPLLTFALVTYNQEDFVTEAVQGAFDQTYSPLEIILSDDYSTDQTYEIIKEMAGKYHGSNKVIVRQNEKNLGLIGHINRLMENVQGELIIIAAGDDVSLPERTRVIYQAYLNSNRRAFSIYSGAYLIDENGVKFGQMNGKDDLTKFDIKNLVRHHVGVPGPTQAWHTSIFKEFGDLDDRMMGEDVIIPFRAALLGGIEYIENPLIYRRHHNRNLGRHPNYKNLNSIIAWQVAMNEKYLNNNIYMWENKLHDIDTIIEKHQHKEYKFVQAKTEAKKSLFQSQIEKNYYYGSANQRPRILLQALFFGTPILRIFRWIIQYRVPKLYYNNHLDKLTGRREDK